MKKFSFKKCLLGMMIITIVTGLAFLIKGIIKSLFKSLSR